jgi:hypothetical protein
MSASAKIVVVAGGRDYVITKGDYQFLESTLALLGAKEIYTDGTPRVAAQAEAWARTRGISVQRVEADWVAEGPAPVSRRNTMLVNLARAVIAFPGDEGTTDLVLKARVKKVPVNESPSRQLVNFHAVQPAPRGRIGTRFSP